MRSIVEKYFDETVNDVFKTDDNLKRFFLGHERKNLFIDNICKEIDLIHDKAILFDLKTFQKLVRDMAIIFCRGAIATKEKEINNKVITSENINQLAGTIAIDR